MGLFVLLIQIQSQLVAGSKEEKDDISRGAFLEDRNDHNSYLHLLCLGWIVLGNHSFVFC